MRLSIRHTRRPVRVLGTVVLLTVLLPQGVARAAPERIDPADLERGADPAVAHLVRDTIRYGDLRVPATRPGRHEALWVVDGGFVVRDYNVGARRLTRVTFIDPAGEQRRVTQSRQWIDVAVSDSGRSLAVQTWRGSLQQWSTIEVSRPSTGRVVASRVLQLATLAAVTDSRVLVGRRMAWRHPVTQWWSYERDVLRRISGQAARTADVGHDTVVFATPSRGEFCTRVAVLSRPSRTLWRSCRVRPQQWSPDGSLVLTTHAYFDAAGTDRWWVSSGRTAERRAGVAGRLDWDAVWEDDDHFLTSAQGDGGGAAIIRCDLSGACERASRVWDVPLPDEPSLYYAPPPVVLAGR